MKLQFGKNKAPPTPCHVASGVDHCLSWISSLSCFEYYLTYHCLTQCVRSLEVGGLASKTGLCNDISKISSISLKVHFEIWGKKQTQRRFCRFNIIFFFSQHPKQKTHSSFLKFISDCFFLTIAPHDLIETNLKTKLGGMQIQKV